MNTAGLRHDLGTQIAEYKAHVEMENLLNLITYRLGVGSEEMRRRLNERKSHALLKILLASRALGEVPDLDPLIDGTLFETALSDSGMFDQVATSDWDVVSTLAPIEKILLQRLKDKSEASQRARTAQAVLEAIDACKKLHYREVQDLKEKVASWERRFAALDPLEQLAHPPADKPARKPRTRRSK